MIRRKAARAILLTPCRRVLLMQAQDPGDGHSVWFAPGGGLEPGEDAEACLRREVFEETGLALEDIGPLVWRRHHTFEWDGRTLSQDEEFFLVPVDRFEPDFRTNPSETELMAFRQYRWWTPDEVAASDDLFAPRRLASHLESLILHGPRPEPVDVGV